MCSCLTSHKSSEKLERAEMADRACGRSALCWLLGEEVCRVVEGESTEVVVVLVLYPSLPGCECQKAKGNVLKTFGHLKVSLG